MSDTANLKLPEIAASQAQKHVTHNEALLILDAIVHLSVLDRDLTEPPGSPADGARYLIGSGATGAWAAKDLNIAVWQSGAWYIYVPRPGWTTYVEDEGLSLTYDGVSWGAVSGSFITAPVTFPTVAAGVITATSSIIVPAAETGTTDTVSTINGVPDGSIVVVGGTAGTTLTFVDDSGNLKLGGNRVLNNFDDTLTLVARGTDLLELMYRNNG